MAPVEIIVQLPRLPARAIDSNKGSFGRVLIVAGSRGMAGAAILSGSAALRSGAGLVRVASPLEIQPTAALGNPCYTTIPLAQDDQGKLAASALVALREESLASDVVALGPGLGRSETLRSLIPNFLDHLDRPAVVDADGLNAFVGQVSRLRPMPGKARIITPHPGEFGRLLQRDTRVVQANRREFAIDFARQHQLVVVLKGHGTIVTDGLCLFQNTTGNPGMATGGTGDVLTGIIAALLGQGLDAFAAAQLGVHVHGLAGDLARNRVGEISLIASDLLLELPASFRVIGGLA